MTKISVSGIDKMSNSRRSLTGIPFRNTTMCWRKAP